MKQIAEAYGFQDVGQFAQYLIEKARQEKLVVTIEITERNFRTVIEPAENCVYICPHYGKTREER